MISESDSSTRRPRILLGLTGSVATIKASALIPLLLEIGEVKVISTDAAKTFYREDEFPVDALPVLGDEDDWRAWKRVGDEVLHISLRQWADALVIAPLSANTLAKIAVGLADNLLTSVARAWDFKSGSQSGIDPESTGSKSSGSVSLRCSGSEDPSSIQPPSTDSRVPGPESGSGSTEELIGGSCRPKSSRKKPLLVAPAMNTAMWDHPVTATHLTALRSWGVGVVPPVSKKLACGDVGVGAMAAPVDIAAALRQALEIAGYST